MINIPEISTKKSSIFIKIEKENNKTLYHTKITKDFYIFGIDKNKNNRFFIILKELFKEKKCIFHLFPLREDDKFLGMYYGYRKPIKNIMRRYEDNGVLKTSTFSKIYYIEFRFKKGSIFCYIKGISSLVNREKIDTVYCKTLLAIIMKLEKEVYEFYSKALPEKGNIIRWIEKNQK
ncbi:DUF226 domain-containing protein (plasmid) [Borrelia miyamotoi]|uniref:DUF226 domain-containing protein n=1 Tax=Borrelia miyamotoi TaxID=47466 RepID=A0A5P8ARM3_9SPIR|nr:DUF226 domain-containing protein [Borrelia miyamotoi]QFP42570.1 DUF226 domain-containing protein [Borrelia miyamotoi]WAZ72932.1 DUF226 domain-containing protein [Borrelia miyamotoi]WVI05742.1 DUF226 domain-containing protein [Borrelia miyamotoi]